MDSAGVPLSSWAPFSKKVRTLSPFGFEFLQGLLCRPKFLCSRARWMIARNANQAAEDCRERRRTGAQPASARGCHVPKLSYTGCVVTPLWQDPVLVRLENELQEPRDLAPVRVRWRLSPCQQNRWRRGIHHVCVCVGGLFPGQLDDCVFFVEGGLC